MEKRAENELAEQEEAEKRDSVLLFLQARFLAFLESSSSSFSFYFFLFFPPFFLSLSLARVRAKLPVEHVYYATPLCAQHGGAFAKNTAPRGVKLEGGKGDGACCSSSFDEKQPAAPTIDDDDDQHRCSCRCNVFFSILLAQAETRPS